MDKFVKVKWLEPPHSIEYETIPSNWIEKKKIAFGWADLQFLM